MADLAFAPRHNMIAYLKKTERGGDSLVRATTTASLDAQQDSSNITKIQSKATLNEPTPRGEGLGSGRGSQETMGVKWLRLDLRVLDMENVKTAQAKVIANLKKRVTKIEQRQSSKFFGFHPFRAGTSKRHGLGSTAETVSTARPDISTVRQEVSTVEPKTPPTTTTLFDDEDSTIADTLVKMKNQKAKEKGIAFKDANNSARPIRSITTLQPLPTIDPKDKGKGILQESEPVKKSKKMDQDQIKRDAEVSLKIQADLDKKAKTERERQKEASKAALAEMKKQLAKKRAKVIRSKPPTKTQLRNLMMTYLKHTDAFVPIRSEEDKKRIRSRKKRVVGSSKKHKSPKKQKVNDQESKDSDKEHRKCLKLVPDDDKAIDYETLDVKSPIVD
nr:hypothetical protein [Tanacetum cinerariifolium]